MSMIIFVSSHPTAVVPWELKNTSPITDNANPKIREKIITTIIVKSPSIIPSSNYITPTSNDCITKSTRLGIKVNTNPNTSEKPKILSNTKRPSLVKFSIYHSTPFSVCPYATYLIVTFNAFFFKLITVAI